MHPWGIFLAHHHLTLLINRAIHLQRLWSSGYTLSAKRMGRNLWPYCLEVAKVSKQKKNLGPGCDASEKWKHWGTLQDSYHPQRAAQTAQESLPCLTSEPPQWWWPGRWEHSNITVLPPVQMVARGTPTMGTRAIANLCTIGSCLTGTMTLDHYWFSVCLWDRDVRYEVSSRFLNSFKTTISWTFLATLPSVHYCLHSVYFI